MKDRLFTIAYMVIITAVATALMTGAKALLAERIKRNETLQERRTQLYGLGLLPEGADAERIDAIFSERVKLEERSGVKILFGYAEGGKTLQSIGFEFEGMGFWGPIRGIMALDPDRRKLVGLAFLRHQETPGLGGRMTERWFLEQFKGKDAAKPDAEGRYLIFRPEGTKAAGPREVNAISGATRTSESLKRILNETLKDFQNMMAADQAAATRE